MRKPEWPTNDSDGTSQSVLTVRSQRHPTFFPLSLTTDRCIVFARYRRTLVACCSSGLLRPVVQT